MGEYCCEQMRDGIENGIIHCSDNEPHFHINGAARLVDDGDGHFDDMTDWVEIRYCPFCGTQL